VIATTDRERLRTGYPDKGEASVVGPPPHAPFTPPMDDIVRLALEEASPDHWARFQPICRGPLFAVAALVAILLSALPWIAVQIVRAVVARQWRRDQHSM